MISPLRAYPLLGMLECYGLQPWVLRDNTLHGSVAQLGERLICIQEVVGSTPIGSTKIIANLEATLGDPKFSGQP